MTEKRRVSVSYSRKDSKWLERLKAFLRFGDSKESSLQKSEGVPNRTLELDTHYVRNPQCSASALKENHMTEKRKVFVSYSRKDSKWLERLKTFLRPLERDAEL